MNPTENRIGRIRVSCELIKNWPSLVPGFSGLVVIHVEQKYPLYFEFLAFSEKFDIVLEGDEPPLYCMIYACGDKGPDDLIVQFEHK